MEIDQEQSHQPIGVFSYSFYPYTGGVGSHVYHLCEAMKNQGILPPLVFSPTRNDIPYHRPLPKSFFGINNQLLFSLYLNAKLERLIKKHRLEVVHSHSRSVYILKKPSVPHLTTVHHTQFQQMQTSSKKYYPLLLRMEKQHLSTSDHIIAVSESTRDSLINDYAIDSSKITLIHNGVDTNFFKPLPDIEKIPLSILYVGRLTAHRKGLDFLIESFRKLKQVQPQAKLNFIGTGPYRSTLEQKIDQLKLDESIKLLGYVENNELLEWLNKSELLVLPSQIEGFGVSLVEAMACNTPVIGTNVPGIRDIITHNTNGLLAQYNNSSDLSEKMMQILTNPDLKNKLTNQAAKDVKEKFNWDILSLKLNQTYSNMLQLPIE